MSAPFDLGQTGTNTPRRAVLPRWIGVVFPFVFIAASSFAAAHMINHTIQSWALSLGTTAGTGLVSGFAARWSLPRRADFRRLLAALVALTVGLLLLGLLTLGKAGIGPLKPPFAEPDWIGLGHFALGTVAAWLALRAWRNPPTKESMAPRVGAPRNVGARISARWGESAARHGIVRVGSWLARPREWMRQARRSTIVSEPTAPSSARLVEPKNVWWNVAERLRIRRNSLHIRLRGAEEKRCPYCLELVQRNDPRGVVVCNVCRTAHHGDCWAVAGVCQVPHQHA